MADTQDTDNSDVTPLKEPYSNVTPLKEPRRVNDLIGENGVTFLYITPSFTDPIYLVIYSSLLFRRIKYNTYVQI